MHPEPRNDTGDMSQLIWSNSTELPKGENETFLNTTDNTDTFWEDEYNYIVIFSVILLISLCSMVGNGTVIWLLAFRVKRNPYSVYILNLAFEDFLYLLANVLGVIDMFHYFNYTYAVFLRIFFQNSYLVGLTLLMAISAEHCVSVLWPLWYKCHRPAHLSTILCALIWSLYFTCVLLTNVILNIDGLEQYMFYLFNMVSFLTLPVLSVSSLILVIWGRCCSQWRQPRKLYWTVLLNVLAVLLLSVPRAFYVVCCWKIYKMYIWPIMLHLTAVNTAVNPIIYFFVGRHGIQRGRKSLREVLQNAMTDGDAGTEQRRGITDPRQNVITPEHQGEGAPLSSQVWPCPGHRL